MTNQCAIGALYDIFSASFLFLKALDNVFPDPVCTYEGIHKPQLSVHLLKVCLSSLKSIAIYKTKMNLIQFIPRSAFPIPVFGVIPQACESVSSTCP